MIDIKDADLGGIPTFLKQQMLLALIRGGPGVVNMFVLNDLFSYCKGVYTPSAAA